MKTKTANLVGPALDWAVAKCEGLANPPAAYSTDWALAGPIIAREGISVDCWINDGSKTTWFAQEYCNVAGVKSGPTALIAAMRCYVYCKLGEEVDLPEGDI